MRELRGEAMRVRFGDFLMDIAKSVTYRKLRKLGDNHDLTNDLELGVYEVHTFRVRSIL